MTWGEYSAYSMGLYRRKIETWEQTRKLAYVSASSIGGLEVQEQEFMPLPFDVEMIEPDKATDAELNEFKEYLMNGN